MTGSVELDPDGAHLLIRFPYREDLVAAVKDLPGRRWDPKGKLWRVPAAQVERVYATFAGHLFEFAPEIPALLAGTLGTVAKPAAEAPPRQRALPLPGDANGTDAPPPALSISALNTRVRDALRGAIPDSVWITGEIVDFDKTAGREHRFFQLVEKAPRAARPVAVVDVALFGRTAEWLLPKLAAGEQPLSLRDGIEIRVLVKVDLYVGSGRYQVVVEDIDPSFTLGKLALTREQILAELRQRGLAERNRSRGFPVPALRIGVLTSPESDGWNDFLRHLQEAQVGLDVTLVPIKVQGPELKPSLLRGLAWFADRAERFDVLCIVRGGGSRTDLAWFDDLDLALAVAAHPLKVVVGIGHQRDQSVLDLIAHSEKTPTAVAELLVRGVESARSDTRERAERLRDLVADRLADERRRLQRAAADVVAAAEQRLRTAHRELARAGHDLQLRTVFRLSRERADLRAAAARAVHGTARQFDRRTARLEQHATRLRLLDPVRVLGRGFSIVRDRHGKVLPAAARLQRGDAVQLQFRDGRAGARIDAVQPDSPEGDQT
ncbi:MAG: exodeoxyribonuclease VII large subunit [Planctomycetes bacterium]|nr:exodeoxyribonuclease VII large subunit [Planctomycetota bacterium]